MELDTAITTARSRPKRPAAKGRSRPDRARYNGRSREAVRVRTLAAGFKAQLGNVAITTIMEIAVTRAAELCMLAEMKRAAMIRGEAVDLGDLLRLEGVARRAVADLGIKSPAEREAAAGPSLEEIIAEVGDA